MYEYRKYSPNKLSGGQKQRVSIAGVLAMHPKCIVLDEPTAKMCIRDRTYIYGIGRPSATKILAQAGVNPDTRCRDLTDDEVKKLSEVIDETMTVEGDLRREIALNIKRLQEIGCYRGIRHRKGLPVRGQKTKTNARTRKGPRRTVANKKK